VRFGRFAPCTLTAWILCVMSAFGQEAAPSFSVPPSATVPRLIRIRGTVHDAAGKPVIGSFGITLSLYNGEADQAAVWQEIQTVQLNAAGSYSVLLGAMSEGGLPLEIFASSEARWLGVRPDGQAEQPRILLLSVAYALKAADTDMLGGKPASAFVLADGQASSAPPASADLTGSAKLQIAPSFGAAGSMLAPLAVSADAACASITSDGTATANQVTKFTTACNIENSAIFESGGNVGIGNTTPAGKLDVSGAAFVRGLFSSLAGVNMAPTGAATTTQGFISNPLDLSASVYNTTLLKPVNYIFQWQSEPVGNNSTNTGATLNLLYGVSGDILETGLSISKAGVITFAPGQTFPASGGTVTSVATGAGLTGGPITKTGTISIATGGVTNAMLATPSVTVKAGTGLSGGGSVALGGTITLTNSAPGLGGTVTSVATGTGLTGGPITASGTLSLNTAFTDGRYLQLDGGTLTGALTGTTATFTGALKGTSGTFSGTVTTAATAISPMGTATATVGFNSNPFDLKASSFSSSTAAAVTQDFRWQAEPTGNDTATPSAALHLLFGSNGAAPAETGLSVASNGRLTFASGQTFPGTSTITQVSAGTGLAGGGTTGNVTLSLLKTCVAGQTLLWSGTAWGCGSFGTVSGATDGLAYFSGPGSVTSTAAPADGEILIGSAGGAPVLANLTAGTNVTITNGPGSIKISAAGAAALPFFSTGGQQTGSTQSAGQNINSLWGFLLPYSVTTTQVTYNVTTADNTANLYDIGVFNNSGALIEHIGATAGTTFASATGFHSLSWAEGSKTLAAGRYYLAFTTNCTSGCAAIGAAPGFVSFAINASGGASTAGALPATLTLPADTWATGNQPTVVVH
jgi:hypothetical protein